MSDELNLCDTCKYCFGTCVSEPTFGDEEGEDNVIECTVYCEDTL